MNIKMTSEIKVCMGSACFAKGNQENLEYIKEYIAENNFNFYVDCRFGGSVNRLCQNN